MRKILVLICVLFFTANFFAQDSEQNDYQPFEELLDKYEDLCVLDIAVKESLSVSEISKLYYVKDSRAGTEQPESKEWEKVLSLYNQEQNETILKQLCVLEEGEFKEYKSLFFTWHLSLLIEFAGESEVIDYISSNLDYIEALPKDGNIYFTVMYYYLCALNNTFQPYAALQLVAGIPDYLQTNIHYYYQYAYANYLMLSYCETQEELDFYRKNAKYAFEILQKYDYKLSELVKSWLKRMN